MAKRKMNEKSLKNLKKANPKNNFNCSEIARKAQKKSVKSRCENKKLSELLKIGLLLCDDETGELNDMVIVKSVINRAKQGDIKAMEFIRDTIGEKPVDNINTTTVTRYITEEEVRATNKHIDDVINGTR